MEKQPINKPVLRPNDSPVGSLCSDEVNRRKYQGDLRAVRCESVAELLNFYASIPDYGEVHHLPDVEFYQRLQNLREKRRNYMLQDVRTSECNACTTLTGQENCENNFKRPILSFKQPNEFSLAGKKCEIHCKMYDSPSLTEAVAAEEKVSRNRGTFFEVDFRNERFASTPETYSVVSSDAGQRKCNLAKTERKMFTNKSKRAVANQTKLTRVESSSSVTGSDKSVREYCNKYECLSDSDSPPPLSYPSFRGSKILKRKINRPKTTISTPLPVSSRKNKLWTPDLDERTLASKSRCSEKQNTKSVICLSAPDLRGSPVNFKARSVPKYLFSSHICRKMQAEELCRSRKKKIKSQEVLKSCLLPPSIADRKKCSRPNSSNIQEVCGSKLADSECSSAKGRNIFSEKSQCEGGNCEKQTPATMGCVSTSEITHVSSNESFPAALHIRSYPQSIVIPSKNNLAAILRIQATRQKMERDLEEKLVELKRKEDACIKAHLARQQPAWQAIQYSIEEDLALRRILRKEKERKHQREHQQQMNLMLARVQQIPPLFERQTARRQGKVTNRQSHNAENISAP